MENFRMLLVVILAAAVVTVTEAQNPPTDADCTGPDPFPDPAICSSYYQCFLTDTGYVLVHLDCPPGGIWMDNACVEGTCDDPTTTTEPTTVAPTTEEAPTTEAQTTTTTPAPTTPSTTTTTQPTTTTTTTTTTTSPPVTNPPTFQCPSEGLFPHPTDPTKYYQCVLIGAQFYYYVYSCPANSCFQQSLSRCVVGSCAGSATTAPTPTTPTTRATTPTTTIRATTPTTTTRATIPTTTPTTTRPTTTPSTTVPPNPCPSEGFFPNPSDCQAYYRCIRINGQMYLYNYRCQAGAYWSRVYNSCVVGTCPA